MMSYRKSVHWIKPLVFLTIGALILCVTQKTGAGADTVRVAYSSPTATQGILWVADVGGLFKKNGLVDLIVVTSAVAALAAKKATTTIPIVMTTSTDPVGEGLVASLARPGGNVTGLWGLANELNTKRLEVLKDAVPKLARVGLLRAAGGSVRQLKDLRLAALALKLKLEEIETQPDAKGLESAFQTAKQKQVGAIMTTTSRPFLAERKRIVELAVKYLLPAIYPEKGFVDEGGLMSYGVDFDDLYRHAAVYVDKILRGAKPADLPVQQATKFEFVINLKAAKQIGLTLSPEFLSRANQVIR